MSFSYFPEFYEDELVYSLLARYYAHSGHMSWTFVFRELYGVDRIYPNFLFVNKMTDDTLSRVCNGESFETIIKQHTLYPYYSLFLADKDKILQSLVAMDGNYYNLLSITRKPKEKEYMRYCPECVKEDRELHGETYWHRTHQIPEIAVCVKHGCRLCNSKIEKNLTSKRMLLHAELSIDHVDEAVVGGEQELSLARFIIEMMEKNDSIGGYTQLLTNRICELGYSTRRGILVGTKKLFDDLFVMSGGDKNGITKQWQLELVINGKITNVYMILQTLYLLGVKAEDFDKADRDIRAEFESTVVEMIEAKKSIAYIAKTTGMSQSTIRAICNENSVKSAYQGDTSKMKKEFNKRMREERKFWLRVVSKNSGMTYSDLCKNAEYKNHLRWLRKNDKAWTDEHYPASSRTSKMDNLNEMDDECLGDVKKAISNILELDQESPQRITISRISKQMKWKDNTLYRLPKCVAEIEKHTESQEKFWCRKTIWAIKKMVSEGVALSHTQFYLISSISRNDLRRCADLVYESGDEMAAQLVREWLLSDLPGNSSLLN